MKRQVVFFLILTLLMNFVPLKSLAEKSYDKELKEAIIKAKNLFSIGNDYDVFKQSVDSNKDNTIFYLSWSDKDEKLESISLAIDIGGNVLSYSRWGSQDKDGSKENRISKDRGLEIAKDFIKRVGPAFYNNIKYVESQEPININYDSYSFNFYRVEKDLPYYNNTIQVTVNSSTGKVDNYYANWDFGLVFPNNIASIDLEKSQLIYQEKIGLDLVYKSNNIYRPRSDQAPKMYLAYRPSKANLTIDAFTGDLVETNIYKYSYDMDSGGLGGVREEAMSLSPEEEMALDEVSGLISKDEAEKHARKILEIDTSFILESSGVYKNYRSGDYNWSLSFRKKNIEGDFSHSNIVINAKTKELISFWKDLNMDKKVPDISREKALEIAENYMNKYNPDKKQFLELKEDFIFVEPLNSENKETYYFTFARKLDQAYVENDGISLSIYKGQPSSYSVNWTNGEFDSQDSIISLGEAYKILFNQLGMELKYIAPKDRDKENKAQLVYGLKTNKPALISAKDGVFLSQDGKAYREQSIGGYSDIDNSYARDKINTLLQYGIGLPGSEFKPKENILEKDFLALLLKSIDFYYEIDDDTDNLYKILEKHKILKKDEGSPDSLISKENSIKYIIRALKYDRLADLGEIYRDIFKDSKDIDPSLTGYITLAYGLGIIEYEDGSFNPKESLTREDALVLIYHYLFLQ